MRTMTNDASGIEFKVATTYGGGLGRLVRRLGFEWNHVILTLWQNGQPALTFESNWRGVVGHPFEEEQDLAEEHAWWVPREPLTELEKERLIGFCLGAEGKWYALHYWVAIGWRVLRRLLLGPARWRTVAALPAETCVTFVDAACRSVGRPVSAYGAQALPDDIAVSPWWRREGEEQQY